MAGKVRCVPVRSGLVRYGLAGMAGLVGFGRVR